MAPYLEEMTQARWLRNTAFWIALVGGIAIAGAGLWAAFGHSAKVETFIVQRELEDLGHRVFGMVVVIGLAFIAAAAWFRPKRGIHALLAGIAALWLVWSFWSYPLLNDSSSAKGVMQKARELAGLDAEIGLVAWKEQNLLMAEGRVRDFGFLNPWDKQLAEAIAWQAENPAHRPIFILDEAMGACIDRAKATRVGHANRREWWLVPQEAIVEGCVPDASVDEKQDKENAPEP
jgi:uncharacterized membrane protein